MIQDSIIYDEEVERRVLSAILGSRSYYDAVAEMISEDCFYDWRSRLIFRCIKKICDEGGDPEPWVVTKEAKMADSRFEPAIMADYFAPASNLGQAIKILQYFRKRRIALELARTLASDAEKEGKDIDETIIDVSQRLADAISTNGVSDQNFNDAAQEMLDVCRKNAAAQGTCTGTPTGFRFWDSKGGLQPSDLIIIAAESSQGKTSLAVSIVVNALKAGYPVAFYSMEMTQRQLTTRITSSQTGVSSSAIMFQALLDFEMRRVTEFVDQWQTIGKNLHFDDKSTSGIDSIISSIRSKARKYHIAGAVVDYLQILNVNVKNANKEELLAEVARRLKNLAKELDIWIIGISQLSRDRENPVPSIKRMRGSGQIEEAADVVLLIYRPEQIKQMAYPSPYESVNTHGTAMIEIAKGRNIGQGTYFLGYEAQTTSFYDLPEGNIPIDSNKQQDESPF